MNMPEASSNPGHPREPRDHAHVPVELLHANALGGRGADGEIEIGMVEPDVEFGQPRCATGGRDRPTLAN